MAILQQAADVTSYGKEGREEFGHKYASAPQIEKKIMIRQNSKFGSFRIEEVGGVILLKEKYVNNLFSDVFFFGENSVFGG